MKIRKWHLFVLITLLFGISFFVVNLKFDKFYRLNGINNDNRVLIEAYLDEDEQEYLIENQLPIEEFIDLIEEDDFNLYNYQYYNLLRETGRYKKNSSMIDMGNNLSARLDFLYNNDALKRASLLIENNLENDFMLNENFDFQYLNLYLSLKPLYLENDFTYIDDTLIYIERLKLYDNDIDLEETFQMLCSAYTKDSLKELLTIAYDENINIVYNPYEFTTIVDTYNYIGQYTPKDLLLTQDVPRVNYSMYLQKDAYLALVSMYQDLSEEFDGFLLTKAYQSYDILLKNEENAGYNEMQLGTSVCLSQSGVSYHQFEETEMCQWLETHAHEYGFVLRYPKNKASITNYSYDPHTYRYVGKALATTLYNSQMTLEEYSNQPSQEANTIIGNE